MEAIMELHSQGFDSLDAFSKFLNQRDTTVVGPPGQEMIVSTKADQHLYFYTFQEAFEELHRLTLAEPKESVKAEAIFDKLSKLCSKKNTSSKIHEICEKIISTLAKTSTEKKP
jgi:hypothetical protein